MSSWLLEMITRRLVGIRETLTFGKEEEGVYIRHTYERVVRL